MSEQKQDAELRAKFEEWARRKQYICVRADKDSFHTYQLQHVEDVWTGFQAASSLFSKDAERLREALQAMLAERSPAAQLSNACLAARAALEGEPK